MTAAPVEEIPVVLIGASGLLAGELARLLEQHSTLSLAAAVSRSDATAMHSHLATPLPRMTEEAAIDLLMQRATTGPAAVVLGLPHGASAERWRSLRETLGDVGAHVHSVRRFLLHGRLLRPVRVQEYRWQHRAVRFAGAGLRWMPAWFPDRSRPWHTRCRER